MTIAPDSVPYAESQPHVVLDGDVPRCSECDSAHLVAAETSQAHYLVSSRALLPLGGHTRPRLLLVPSATVSTTGIAVRCDDCGNTLATEDLDVEVSL